MIKLLATGEGSAKRLRIAEVSRLPLDGQSFKIVEVACGPNENPDIHPFRHQAPGDCGSNKAR
jgi:hypothetical protein